MADTPEVDKLIKISESEDSQTIGEFLEWALFNGYHLTKTVTMQVDGWREGDTDDREYEQPVGIEEILAHYYGIDLAKVRAEKEAVLAELRASSVCQRGVVDPPSA